MVCSHVTSFHSQIQISMPFTPLAFIEFVFPVKCPPSIHRVCFSCQRLLYHLQGSFFLSIALLPFTGFAFSVKCSPSIHRVCLSIYTSNIRLSCLSCNSQDKIVLPVIYSSNIPSVSCSSNLLPYHSQGKFFPSLAPLAYTGFSSLLPPPPPRYQLLS